MDNELGKQESKQSSALEQLEAAQPTMNVEESAKLRKRLKKHQKQMKKMRKQLKKNLKYQQEQELLCSVRDRLRDKDDDEPRYSEAFGMYYSPSMVRYIKQCRKLEKMMKRRQR